MTESPVKRKEKKKISKKHPGNFSASAVCDVHMCMYVKIGGGATKAKEMLTYGDVEHELGLNVSLLFLFALPDIVCEPE